MTFDADGKVRVATETPAEGSDDRIAIIGMACLFPQAPDLHAFWRNIMQRVDAVSEPQPGWDAERYLSSGRIKTPSGGYLKDLYRFDPREFGIMPSSLDGGEPDQFLALKVARDALRDAGYAREDYDHCETGIVLGHSTYLHRGQGTLIQNHIVLDQTVELLQVLCPQLGDDGLSQVREVLARALPASTADIAPGLVPNVMTGRIANRLNFKGPNYLIDAACSSSLLAVSAAVDELRAGRSRMMLAGGVNASLPPEVAVIYTQLGALSGRGKVRPFEAGSDGTLLGEGLGVVVLKRVVDALADGDRIYALVRGIGQASDGRGQGLLAPSLEGETLAIRRAYASTGVDPASIGLIEAHGTGIPLGDKTEVAALGNVFGCRGDAPRTVALGSVKSMISHCIPAAGIAGLIKSAMALHHKVLPPTLCDEVNPELGLQAPLYVNTVAAPWIAPSGTSRRAGINSFGFGGINTHAILEEAPQEAQRPAHATPWPAELCVFSATDKAALVASLEGFAARLPQHPEWTLPEIAAALATIDAGSGPRLSMVAKDVASLAGTVAQALKRLRTSTAQHWSTRGGIVYAERPLGGKLAFLFPGEGSQYAGMFADLALVFDEVRQWLDFWCGLYAEPAGSRRTDIAFPPAFDLTPQRRAQLEQRLHEMDVGSEAAFVGGQAMYSLLRALGVTPDVMLGHSSGESSALAASGALGREGPAQVAELIRKLNAVYRRILADGKIPTGALLTVGALPRGTVEQLMAEVDRDLVIAMDNCPNQLVLYGTSESIAALERRLASAGGICMLLPFDRGYHTTAFAAASAAFLDYYHAIGLEPPSVPLYSCASAQRFPDEPKAARELAAAQWSQAVRFRETVERMHDEGVRTFVEVGPSGNLSAFVNDILAGREYRALATNLRRRDSVQQLLAVVGQLHVEGRPLRLQRLFEARAIDAIDLTAGPADTRPLGMLLDNTMPKIRLDEPARARLRELAAGHQPAAVPAPAQLPAEPPDELPSTAPTLPPAAAEIAAHERVMSSYFELMRTFLDQQPRVLQALGAMRPGEAPPPDAEPGVQAYTPFLDFVVEHDERHVVAHCRLDLSRDNFLRDHVLSGAVSERDPELLGLSCVPLMVSLEIMAEACALLAGSPALQVIENVVARDWIALDEYEVTLEVRAEVVDAGRGEYSASLIGPSGVAAISAEMRFGHQTPRCSALRPLTEHRPSLWNDEGLYTSGMFHGPVFQSIAHIDGWDDHGIDARLSPVSLYGFFVEGALPALVLNPVLLDAMGQLAAYWIAQQAGTDFNCFPSTIERIELYEACPQELSGAYLRARQMPLDATATEVSAPRAWDFECVDAEGRPLARVTNLRNVHYSVPHRFYEVRRDPRNGWLGEPRYLPGVDSVMLWELPLLADEFCSQSAGIFMRILAHVYLSSDERDAWRALTGNVRRRREWLLGRACIKEAARYWILQRTGQLLCPADVLVLHDEQGAPQVDGSWRGSLVDAPTVSLSHDRTACVVAISDPDRRVGIDREEVDRVQQPELVVEALTTSEQALLHGLDDALLRDRLMRIWCAKEATAKLLGVGLQGMPEAFEVRFTDADFQTAFVEHANTPVHVDLHREGTSIIALASEPLRGVL